MKKISLIMVVTFVTMSLITSCSKGSNGNADSTPSATMSATVNGIPWKAETIYDGLLLREVSDNSQNLILRGLSSNNTQIFFGVSEKSFNDCVALGEYVYDDELNAILFYDTIEPQIIVKGKITITKCNSSTKLVSGTFDFTNVYFNVNSMDTLYIRNGVFTDVHYAIAY